MKKSHPVRRAVLAGAATVSGIVLLLSLKPASDPGSAAAAGGAAPPAAEAPQGGRGAGTGTVTGDAADTQYGPVQVRLTVSGGKVTAAEAVQAPKGGQSDQVTADAVPKLNQAAVTAGTADIDAVSGATYTSAGYQQSLQSALDKAAAAGSADETGAGGEGGAAETGAGGAGQGTQVLTGDVTQTQYGPVQVRVTVNGGKITNAETLQAPKGGRSDQVTADAVPKLNQAAVTAGTADIDAVSGATYTSAGYQQSLQSALDKAGG
ncbi:FMN-binding protein [Streptomyces olivaceus]|uniref:FMN-binding protein n=1 Tax=Streptomyces olivaceus TaxID=47716 RepID=A0ABS7W3X2_STROV|nr:FMN-binding protein [Streptomyces olivaceus]MBZ6090179.1 FMN-binding protein [Streptomyces olivaceus]MBZ6096355.1 FMN-binding protein [Streptomyces olivaceus]MBZ6117249.1 FMN-binding protein [Streptomyces olivaceus]MBZ6152679.1 FMN-binding protein [Streptomyces olivaceus]MBZ6194673.1 FMN-binding protein [Streptomyces olivaceus]